MGHDNHISASRGSVKAFGSCMGCTSAHDEVVVVRAGSVQFRLCYECWRTVAEITGFVDPEEREADEAARPRLDRLESCCRQLADGLEALAAGVQQPWTTERAVGRCVSAARAAL